MLVTLGARTMLCVELPTSLLTAATLICFAVVVALLTQFFLFG